MRLVLKPFTGEMSRPERQRMILEAPADEVFTIAEPSFGLPETARIFKTIICENCSEGAPEHKIRLQDGKMVCLDCFKSYSRGW
jgi:formylmethanofuran dehydrogenase subunit E